MKMMVAALALAMAAVSSPGYAETLFDNGPVVNGSGLSILTSPATTLGVGSNSTATVADDFRVSGAGWNVSSFDFYGYQTQLGTGVFTFTSATWSVISGTSVNTGAVVASGTTALTNAGLVGYRVTDTTTTNQNRAIFRLNADVSDFNLSAGSYFLTWALAGTSASGPFVPPVLGSLGTGNAMQSLNGAAFTPFVDSGSLQTLDLPFAINGTLDTGAVPEPATWAMAILGFGLIGGAMRRRKDVLALA